MDVRSEVAKLDFRFASTEDTAEILDLVSQRQEKCKTEKRGGKDPRVLGSLICSLQQPKRRTHVPHRE